LQPHLSSDLHHPHCVSSTKCAGNEPQVGLNGHMHGGYGGAAVGPDGGGGERTCACEDKRCAVVQAASNLPVAQGALPATLPSLFPSSPQTHINTHTLSLSLSPPPPAPLPTPLCFVQVLCDVRVCGGTLL
jgi:hypothetical protein